MKKIIIMIISAFIIIFNFSVFAENYTAEDVAPLLSELEIMVGDTNGDLHLDNFVSRAEFTKVAVASSNYRNSVALSLKTSSYEDVPSSHWAAPYIRVGVTSNFCKGYLDATFRPDNTVTYEEGITMLLRVLGYTDDDFGSSWPYGQVGLAEKLGVSRGVDAQIGEELTRRKVALLLYNTLNTKMKDMQQPLISIFDGAKVEDVTIVSINEGWQNEIYTSQGTFKFDDEIGRNDIGRTGDLFVENNNEVVAFVAYDSVGSSDKHIVYSVLDNNIITYCNNRLETLSIPANTIIYENETKSTYSAKSQQMEMGDILYVQKKNNEEVDYIIYEEGNVVGPVTVTEGYNTEQFQGAKLLRNGQEATISDIKNYDVLYYITELNMLLCYSNKITGVYENAAPNKDAPSSVTVSGVSYKVESGTAFAKLSSSGSLKFGDTVTLLLGKTNEIADVLTADTISDSIYGYITETGKKEYTRSDLSKYTSYYIKVITADGNENEYTADTDYETYKNSVRKITFENGTAKADAVKVNSKVGGIFSWEDKKLGSQALSSDLKIIDVSTTDYTAKATYISVFPTRIDQIKISSDNILYAGKNNNNQINSLILKDVTGDTYSYGIVITANNTSNEKTLSGTYTYDINGITTTFNSSGKTYGIKSGQAAKFGFASSGQIDSIQAINSVSETITEITNTTLTAGNKKYQLSDNVVVYKRNNNYKYTLIPLSDIVGNDEYEYIAYYDKSIETGGRIRIIIAK